ncbi:hypothetical protein KEM56_007474 [Ascosphaera pollenicola]|nr:hypothetical protein KEM56_007474 [Ascosphaera pollenicola]
MADKEFPRVIPRAVDPEGVRSYLSELLISRHHYNPAAAEEAVAAWTYGNITDLLGKSERLLERRFGRDVGGLLWQSIQQDVLTDFMNSFHGLLMTSLLTLCIMCAVIYAVISFTLPTWKKRAQPLRRFLLAAGPATFLIIWQFPQCLAKSIIFTVSFFFTLVGVFAWIVRWMEIESEKDDKRELAEHATALKEEKDKRKKKAKKEQMKLKEDIKESIRDAPSTSEDESGYNLRQRRKKPVTE